MGNPNIAIYGGGPLGPDEIATNLNQTRDAGWTTIILGLFHIGRPQVSGQRYGDIVFGAGPIVIQNGDWLLPDASWPDDVAQLKQGSTITQIYASFGGGGGVEDFQSLRTIYEQNGNSFTGTELERNFTVFRQKFPAVDGIDLDCEDEYDPASFIAFCRMLIGLGFSLTFCPYTYESFWTGALAALEESAPGAVKWWNLQCYAGGAGNDPAAWAKQIERDVPGFHTSGFIVAGADAGGGPGAVQSLIGDFAGEPSLGGGFIWVLDEILSSGSSQADYVAAVRQGYGGGPG